MKTYICVFNKEDHQVEALYYYDYHIRLWTVRLDNGEPGEDLTEYYVDKTHLLYEYPFFKFISYKD